MLVTTEALYHMDAGNDISAQFCYNRARHQPEAKQVDMRSLRG